MVGTLNLEPHAQRAILQILCNLRILAVLDLDLYMIWYYFAT